MDFQTDPRICSYMVSLLPRKKELHVLEPTPGKGNLIRALKGYRVTAPKDFWQVSGWFDAVVMNPPFTPMDEGYRILDAVMEMSNVIVALMPWLTLINSQKRTKKIKAFGLVSVTHLPRNAFPGSRVQTCILDLKRGYAGGTRMHFLSDDAFEVCGG